MSYGSKSNPRNPSASPIAWSTCSNSDFSKWYRRDGHSCLRPGTGGGNGGGGAAGMLGSWNLFFFLFSQDVKLLSKDTWVQGTTWLAMGESKVLDLTIAPASAVRSPDVKHGLFISRKFKHKLEYWIIPQLKVKLLLAEDERSQQRKPSRLVERRALRSHK